MHTKYCVMTLDYKQASSKDCLNTMLRILSKQAIGLKIIHLNAQSLYRKLDEFRYIFEDSNIDILCVSETWFTPYHSNDLTKVRGYQLFRADRNGHGGGVAIYVKSCLSCRLCCASGSGDSVEYVFVDIFQIKISSWSVVCTDPIVILISPISRNFFNHYSITTTTLLLRVISTAT